jgi:hypothetical protein
LHFSTYQQLFAGSKPRKQKGLTEGDSCQPTMAVAATNMANTAQATAYATKPKQALRCLIHKQPNHSHHLAAVPTHHERNWAIMIIWHTM